MDLGRTYTKKRTQHSRNKWRLIGILMVAEEEEYQKTHEEKIIENNCEVKKLKKLARNKKKNRSK